MKSPGICLVLLFTIAFLMMGSPFQAVGQDRGIDTRSEERDGPLPHWNERAILEPDPEQSLYPYAVSRASLIPPSSGLVESQPEYGPSEGLILRYSTSSWRQVVTDIVAALTGDPTKDEIAYVVVGNASQEASAVADFNAAGADLAKVVFYTLPSNAIWMVDYGPNFIWIDGAKIMVDSNYYIPSRSLDNFVPTLLAEEGFHLPLLHMGLTTSAGGNLLPGPDRSAFASTVIYEYNPTFSREYIEEQYQKYLGIDTLHLFPHMPSAVDLTGHIDMWMYPIDDDSVIISEFIPGSNPTAMTITENAKVYMEGLGYTVHRPPALVGSHTSLSNASCHYTYTNAFRLNDRIFMPSYAGGDPAMASYDQAALAAYQAAAPECEIIQIPCYDIIWAAGALHCISRLVPRYVDAAPSAHLLSPDGGELYAGGTTHEIRWAASDDVEVTEVDLYYSLDGGATFPYPIAEGIENDHSEPWSVPSTVLPEDQVMVKIIARDGLGLEDGDGTESMLELRDALVSVYDFSVDPGVDRWGYGNFTSSWSELEGTRYPAEAGQEITLFDRNAYDKIAASDAVGDDNDPNRYSGYAPSSGKETTHLFDFTLVEDPALILDLEILWEGYGDNCGQMELYLWDHVASDWGDGRGNTGENHYMDNHAGNRDRELRGHVRSDFSRYLDSEGKITLLLYGELPGYKSFHDYLAVIVTHEEHLTADAQTLSAGAGGTIHLSLDAGEVNRNRVYLVLGSMSGTAPGLPLPGGSVSLPLNWDSFTDLVIANLGTPVFTNFLGLLDGSGKGSATLNAPSVSPNKIGKTMHYAFLLEGAPWNFASNPVPIEFIP